MTLSVRQIQIILEALAAKYGRGYSDDPEVGALQAHLSILLEVAHRREAQVNA